MPRAIGCSRLEFDAGRDAKGFILRQVLRYGHSHDPELAQRQRSCLVENHSVEVPGLLEPTPVPHQKTVAGPQRRGDGHYQRHGQSERVWAGNHQHRHHPYHGEIERCPQQLPHHEGDGRSADRHDGQKPGRAVRQVLRSGLGLLRIGHESHDAGELGLLPRPGDLDAEKSLSIDRGGDHVVAFPLLHRPGLAGDHRLVDVTLPLAHHSVRGNALARTHQQEVTVLQCADSDFLLASIGDPRRGVR